MQLFDLRKWEGFVAAGGSEEWEPFVSDIVIDSRRVSMDNTLFVALPGHSCDGHDFVVNAAAAGAKYALVRAGYSLPSSSVSIQLLHVFDTVTALQEIAAAYRISLPAMFVAITGSRGKTLVKDLLTAFLETSMTVVSSPESFNSQIGVPLSILHATSRHTVAVIEAGISMPGEMSRLAEVIRPTYGIVTHIGDEHNATLGSRKAIAEEKMRLFDALPHNNWVLMPNDPLIDERYHRRGRYWDRPDAGLPQATMVTDKHGSSMTYKVHFPDGHICDGLVTAHGGYFLDIINIAMKAAWLLGVQSNDICTVLKGYIPETMHEEIWRAPSGAMIINEPYGSDLLSIQRALSHFRNTPDGGRKIFVFGGMRQQECDSVIDGQLLGNAIAAAAVDTLVIVGEEEFSSLVDAMRNCSPMTEVKLVPTNAAALSSISTAAMSGDMIILKGATKVSLVDIKRSFTEMFADNILTVNLSAIKGNIEALYAKLPSKTRIMVMVKAMGYGTDSIVVAKFLKTCSVDIVGVAFVDEGITLRKGGVDSDVFIINVAPYDVAKIALWGFESGVSDIETIRALEIAARGAGKILKVHLHVDTGMSRFGCRPDDVVLFARMISESPYLVFEGIMTHFASADDSAHDDATQRQIDLFESSIKACADEGFSPRWCHAANSSAAIRFSLPFCSMVRIGLAAYGLYPSDECRGLVHLKSALSLTSRIAQIQTCFKGETVGYGGTYAVQRPQEKIAVIPLGYFDGLHRRYSGKGYALVRGVPAPFVGTICMDFMMIDVTDIPDAAVGDTVLMFGDDEHGGSISAEQLATSGGSIPYELITCLGPRIQRVLTYAQ